jgi:hypothetical protein
VSEEDGAGRETRVAQMPELGRRLNLCLVEKVEAWAALKAAKASDHALIPGSGQK